MPLTVLPGQNKSVESNPPVVPNIANLKKKRISWKNIVIGVVVGTILVAAVLGGWFWYQLDKINKLSSNSLTQSTTGKTASSSAKKATDSAKTDETAGWKTFTSTKFGFKVKYPSTWTSVSEIDTGAHLYSQEEISSGVFIEVVVDNEANKLIFDRVKTYKVGEVTKVAANIPGANLQDTYTRLNDTVIDNYPAVRYKLEPGFGDADNPKTYNVIINRGGKYYLVINKLYEQSFDEGITILDKMLSTFKLL
jgi:hypothetical protein